MLKALRRKWFPDAIIEVELQVVELSIGDTLNLHFADTGDEDIVRFEILSSGTIQCRLKTKNPTGHKFITIHARPSIRRYLSYWLHR